MRHRRSPSDRPPSSPDPETRSPSPRDGDGADRRARRNATPSGLFSSPDRDAPPSGGLPGEPAGGGDPAGDAPRDRRRAWTWIVDSPYWAVSALLHLLLLGAMMAIPFLEGRERPPADEGMVVRPRADRTPYDPRRPRAAVRRPPLRVQANVRRRGRPDEVRAKVVRPVPRTPRRRPSTRSLEALGSGPGLPPGYDQRRGPGRLGSPDDDRFEDIVRPALEWLWRHQDVDGKWDADGYQLHGRNRPLDVGRYGEDRALPDHDVGVTALAMLAFTGYGQTHLEGDVPRYVESLRRAAGWLRSVQVRSSDPSEDGRYGPADSEQWVYDHAIATMAMAELLAMTNDVIGLKHSVKRAVRLCLRARNEGYGWRYGVRPGENDTSVTGWMVLALKTSQGTRLGIPDEEYRAAFDGALRWFDRATAASGRTGYLAPGDPGSRLAGAHPTPYPYSKELSCMTAVATLCRLFAGESRRSRALRDSVAVLARHPPAWREARGQERSTVNLYYWYYGSYALFQHGGREWTAWRRALLEALAPTQRRGGAEDGSWDPIGEWGAAGGRVYATALGALTVQVHCRYLRVAGEPAAPTALDKFSRRE